MILRINKNNCGPLKVSALKGSHVVDLPGAFSELPWTANCVPSSGIEKNDRVIGVRH
jgi:hypothetical protein